MSRAISFLSAVVVFSVIATTVRAQAGNDKVQVSAIASVSAVQAGKPFWLGFKFTIEPEWHIYWKNPGDSGLTTQVKLTLPEGFTAGEVQFPIPKTIRTGDETNYVYEDQVMLLVKVTPPADLKTGSPVKIAAKTSWLVCKEDCMPGGSPVSIEIPTGETAVASNEDLFKEWSAKLPVKHDPADIDSSTVKDSIVDGNGTGSISINWKKVPGDIQFIPGVMKNGSIADVKLATADHASSITFNISNKKDTAPITGLVTFTRADGNKAALEISIPSTGASKPDPDKLDSKEMGD